MQVFIRTNGFPLTDAIESYVKSRIDFILSRFAGIIRKVEVFIADENGPKGGIDKSCVVRVKTDQHSELVVKDTQDDLYTAITRALARTKQSLTRHIQRSRTINRKQKSASNPVDVTGEEPIID